MSKGNSLGVLAILILLGLGYFIPTAILAVEDVGRKQEEKTFAMDEIELNTSRTDIVEQLSLFSEMMYARIVIEMDEEKESVQESEKQPVLSSEQQNDKSNLNICIQEFWQEFKGNEELKFEKFFFGNYIMMARPNSDSLFSIWECTGVDKEGNQYDFWIDDVTGKIVAFDIPYSRIGDTDGEFYSVMSGLSTYYEFSSYDFLEDLRNLSKMKYWENGINLYDENAEVKLSLNIYKTGDRLRFNIYPNTKLLSELK